jgi:hypothetical protein
MRTVLLALFLLILSSCADNLCRHIRYTRLATGRSERSAGHKKDSPSMVERISADSSAITILEPAGDTSRVKVAENSVLRHHDLINRIKPVAKKLQDSLPAVKEQPKNVGRRFPLYQRILNPLIITAALGGLLLMLVAPTSYLVGIGLATMAIAYFLILLLLLINFSIHFFWDSSHPRITLWPYLVLSGILFFLGSIYLLTLFFIDGILIAFVVLFGGFAVFLLALFLVFTISTIIQMIEYGHPL